MKEGCLESGREDWDELARRRKKKATPLDLGLQHCGLESLKVCVSKCPHSSFPVFSSSSSSPLHTEESLKVFELKYLEKPFCFSVCGTGAHRHSVAYHKPRQALMPALFLSNVVSLNVCVLGPKKLSDLMIEKVHINKWV